MGLCLGLRIGERIMIGDEIVVTLIQTDRGYAKVLVDAPKEIPVDREIIYLRKQKEAENR